MPAKWNARRSACTKRAALPSSRSAKPKGPRFTVRCHQSEPTEPRVIGRSSNGRTTASDAVYLGSNPSLPAKTKNPAHGGVFCFGLRKQEANHVTRHV